MAEQVIVRGPNVQGTYNIVVLNGTGVAGMSLSLTAVAELHKQLGALLDGKVKDQPVMVNPAREDDIVHWGAPGIGGTACGVSGAFPDGAYTVTNANRERVTCARCTRTKAFRAVDA